MVVVQTWLGPHVLVVGGRTRPEGDTTATAEWFDPATGRFYPDERMKDGRSFFSALLLKDGCLLAAGGYRQDQEDDRPRMRPPLPRVELLEEDEDEFGRTTRPCELFLPRLNAWVTADTMRDRREVYTATALPGGGALLAGGFSNNRILASAELYDPSLGRFLVTAPMRTARFGHTATLIGGRVLVAGGRTLRDVSLRSTEWYNPGTQRWSPGPSMTADRFRHTATVLKSGSVLLTGGYSSAQGKTLDTAELYNPVQGRFTELASRMSDGRMDHSATLLADGRVLVVGGWSSQKGSTVVSADLFDPVTNTFSPAAPLPASRHEHAAVALPDGSALITGGLRWEPRIHETLRDAYLYVPQTGLEKLR